MQNDFFHPLTDEELDLFLNELENIASQKESAPSIEDEKPSSEEEAFMFPMQLLPMTLFYDAGCLLEPKRTKILKKIPWQFVCLCLFVIGGFVATQILNKQTLTKQFDKLTDEMLALKGEVSQARRDILLLPFKQAFSEKTPPSKEILEPLFEPGFFEKYCPQSRV